MSNYLSGSEIRSICENVLGLQTQKVNHFMSWLHRQPQLNIGCGIEDFEISSHTGVSTWLWNYNNRPLLVGNAFSLNMLSGNATIDVVEVDLDDVQTLFAQRAPKSCIGHADTAEVFSGLVGRTLPMARATVQLEAGDDILVGQYSGPRLPEGARTLPEGASIKWMVVTIR